MIKNAKEIENKNIGEKLEKKPVGASIARPHLEDYATASGQTYERLQCLP